MREQTVCRLATRRAVGSWAHSQPPGEPRSPNTDERSLWGWARYKETPQVHKQVSKDADNPIRRAWSVTMAHTK